MSQVQKKVVILGDSGVGKTSILLRLTTNKFDPQNLPTLGASFKSYQVPMPSEGAGESIKLNIWDTAGQEKFKSLTKMYYQDAEAAVIVYDITFRESFESAKNWIQDLRENANVPDLLIALVGNKCDLAEKAEIQLEEAYSFGRSIKSDIIKETSARDSIGLTELFQEIGTKLYKKQKAIDNQNSKPSKPTAHKLTSAQSNTSPGGNGKSKGKGGCCK